MAERSEDSAKDKFREALERKRGKKHPHESASAADPKIQEAHERRRHQAAVPTEVGLVPPVGLEPTLGPF